MLISSKLTKFKSSIVYCWNAFSHFKDFSASKLEPIGLFNSLQFCIVLIHTYSINEFFLPVLLIERAYVG